MSGDFRPEPDQPDQSRFLRSSLQEDCLPFRKPPACTLPHRRQPNSTVLLIATAGCDLRRHATGSGPRPLPRILETFGQYPNKDGAEYLDISRRTPPASSRLSPETLCWRFVHTTEAPVLLP